MNIPEIDTFSALRQISAIVANSSDMVEILRLARRYLAEIVPYDTLAILVDDRDRECLTAPIAFNDCYSPDSGEWTLTYGNSMISEALITRKSRSRFNLSSNEGLLHANTRCDLLVPMCTPDNVVGCLYFGRSTESPFKINEQANAEQAAGLLAMVLERAKNYQEIQIIRDSLNRWQEQYLILLEALPYAAVVVDLVSNQIQEFNEAFEELVGYASEELHSIDFSYVLPQKASDEHLTVEQFSQKDGQTVSLVHKNGNKVQVNLGIGTVPIGGPERCLLIFHSMTPQPTESIHDLDVFFFMLSCLQPPTGGDLSEVLREPLDRLAVMWGTKYVSLASRSSEGSLRTLSAFRLSEGIRKELHEPWLSSLCEEPFFSILQSQQPAIIGDVRSDPDFQKWRGVALRLGYTSLVSLPLIITEQSFGLLNLFFEKPRVWTEVEKETFIILGRAIARVIENNRDHSEAAARSERAEIYLKLSNQLKTNQGLEDIITITAKEMYNQLHFDLLFVTFFNQHEEGVEVLGLGSEKLGKALSTDWNWERLVTTELGRLIPKNVPPDQRDSSNNKTYDDLVSAMNEKVSVLLLSHDNYFGNLTLGRMQKEPFQSEDVKFIRQIASLIGEIIENYRRGEFDSSEPIPSAHNVRAGIQLIHEELEVNTVVDRIRKTTSELLNASECIVKILDNDFKPADVADIIPGVGDGLVSEKKAAELVGNLIHTGDPLVIEDSTDFFRQHGDETGLQLAHGFGSYLLVLASKDQRPMAILAISWSEQREISTRDKNLAVEIAAHSALALASAQCYQEALGNTKVKEDFIYTVSHELKAPLASIKSLTAFLHDDYKDALTNDGFKYLSRIQNNLDHMENMITNLLDFSRLGCLATSFSFVSSAEIIDRAMIILSSQIERTNVIVEVTENLPEIYCDATGMMQVFINLISNAIKHTRDDTSNPLIEIGHKGGELFDEFIVRDNGVGIAEEYHDKIFNIFYTVADEAETRSSGVGLAIVKKIVENHGGKIWVISSLGKGAEFHFTIAKMASDDNAG